MVGYVNVCIFASVFFTGVTVLSVYGNETVKYDTKLSEVVFVVLAQPNEYHIGRARQVQIHFMDQLKDMKKADKPPIYITPRKWPNILGSWTIFPLLKIWTRNFPGKKWVFFCEDETRIHLSKLEPVIQRYDPAQDWFLGHALRDREPTIIHHFESTSKRTFPDFAAGVLLSFPLVKKLADRWPDDEFRADFAIDPKYELAYYVNMNNISLTDVKELCTDEDGPDCATSFPVKFPDCGPAIHLNDLFVAVKTCEKFHTERVPVVLKTWARETSNIEFYSETEDKSIPTIDLGVPNTERGHCGKTMALMKRAVTMPHILDKKWLLVADDDTIINIKRLLRLLSCYNANSLVAIGERYGYQVAKGTGYDYITGGGGMVFSMPVVQRLVAECQCRSDDAPDDMIIGMCLRRMEIPVTHVPYLHQARPADYSEGYLARQIPISFHKHWNCDPYEVYQMLKDYDTEKGNDSTNDEMDTVVRDEL